MPSRSSQLFLCAVALAAASLSSAQQSNMVKFVPRPDTSQTNDHYVGNRAPLAPSAFIKLPVGAVKPKGFLLEYLKRQRSGMTGNLGELSAWLQKDENAWLSEEGQGKYGWEEVPYWLKGYGNLAYLLEDPEMIAETKIWIEGAFKSQRKDGNFGPLLTFDDDGSQDFWANMIMLFCLQSYYEHSGDERVIDLMTKYFKFQLTVPDDKFLTHYWQYLRGGDNLYSVYWLYNRTGDDFLLELAEKIHRNTGNWMQEDTLPNWHNVNVAQSFGEPGTYYLQSKDPEHLEFAYKNFRKMRDLYGQVPGGMFGSDENARPGYDDPRQAVETCGLVEQMLSNETLLAITGDPFWADHTEEVAFNSYTAATLPDFRGLRYLTSPNQVVSDRLSHSPGIQNGGPMFMMNPLSHRCCQHNHSHGWPYMVEHLWMATPDNGLLAAMYSECEVTAKVGDGTPVTITEETQYPFRETVKFTITTPKNVSFPLYLRVPAWCKNPQVAVNGMRTPGLRGEPGYLVIDREWATGETVELTLPMEVNVTTWDRNHDSVSVNYGPLTFSLQIGEEYVQFPSEDTTVYDSRWIENAPFEQWPAFEIRPTTPWNYGLDQTALQSMDFEVVKRDWPKSDFPWTLDAVPLSIKTKGRKIPEWQLDQYTLVSVLQDSPAMTAQPAEDITLVPMGAARLRISAFPVASPSTSANKWIEPQSPPDVLPYNPTSSHTFFGDSIEALCDQLLPGSSGDESLPRFTWWDHKGTKEWVQYTFAEPREVSSVEVYWFDDTGNGECRTPLTWRILYKKGDQWVPVETTDEYGTARDTFNKVAFKPVTAKELRLEVQLKEGFSGGVLEWRVLPK